MKLCACGWVGGGCVRACVRACVWVCVCVCVCVCVSGDVNAVGTRGEFMALCFCSCCVSPPIMLDCFWG